jgi:hypothetical protein
MLGSAARKYSVMIRTDSAPKTALSTTRPTPTSPPNARSLAEVTGRDVVLRPLDDPVVLVELSHGGVLAQVVEVVRHLLGEGVALLHDGRHHGEAEAHERRDHTEEHDADRHAAAHVPRHQPLDRGVETDGEEQRDDDQHEDATCLDERLGEEPGEEHPERAEEAEHERRVAP